ncbi:hypothetical protein VNO78_33488 [Psophocarpus tetragonolobus]|uniref:Uncharacterized protein n=1 Tax=Psophocarpus tetragonolobus TaxID=3891 RepID=A0AAN9P2A5_PSOTE
MGIGARGRQTNRLGGGVEIGARPALQVFGGRAGGIRGGENGVAEEATEFNGFWENRFGVVNEQRFKKAFVALLRRLRRSLVGGGRLHRGAGVGGRHCE